MRAAYYWAPLSTFLKAEPAAILGELAKAHSFALEQPQRDAWLEQISIMKRGVHNLASGHILFEFVIPRMGMRRGCGRGKASAPNPSSKSNRPKGNPVKPNLSREQRELLTKLEERTRPTADKLKED